MLKIYIDILYLYRLRIGEWFQKVAFLTGLKFDYDNDDRTTTVDT